MTQSAETGVLSGAPFGYRYVRKTEPAEARYEIVAHEAAKEQRACHHVPSEQTGSLYFHE